MVEIKRVEKYNPVARAWEVERYPFDVRQVHTQRTTADADGDLDLGSYEISPESYTPVTAIRFIADTAAWLSVGGAITDYIYIPGAGEGALEGSPGDPVLTLDEGESLTFTALNAASGQTYGVVTYGAEREKKPQRYE